MYKHVIVSVDLSADSQKIIDEALLIVGENTQCLRLVHVVEPVSAPYSAEFYASTFKELEQKALVSANEKLEALGAKNSIPAENCFAMIGLAADEVRRLAKENNSDLIVIGSHGRSGWRLLLGSTANKLLHGATCNVYTVFVDSDSASAQE